MTTTHAALLRCALTLGLARTSHDLVHAPRAALRVPCTAVVSARVAEASLTLVPLSICDRSTRRWRRS